MNHWTKAGAAVLALTVLGTMAGCGGEKASSSPAKSAPVKKELKVVCNATYPPFAYKDEKGNIVGFDVDITKAVAKELGAKVVYEATPFDKLIPALVDNKADIAVSAADMTKDRQEKVDFSSIYYSKESVSVLARKDDNEIKSPEDLKGKKVAVQKGTLYVETAKRCGAEVKEYALILDKPVARFYLAHGASDKLKQAAVLPGSGGFVMLLNKKDEGLQKQVNDALDKLMKNGEYDKIHDKWFADENVDKAPAMKK